MTACCTNRLEEVGHFSDPSRAQPPKAFPSLFELRRCSAEPPALALRPSLTQAARAIDLQAALRVQVPRPKRVNTSAVGTVVGSKRGDLNSGDRQIGGAHWKP